MTNPNYLGSFPVEISDTPFANFTPADWALRMITTYGGIEGAHHKAWVLDQVARILNGTPIVVTERRWTDHKPELDFETGEPTQAYHDWVRAYQGEFNHTLGEYEYTYEEGIAP